MSSKNKPLLTLAFLSAFLVVPLSFSQPANAKEAYKIGVTFPLSGSLAGWGQLILPSIQIAVDEQNKNGGIRGHEVKLIIEDTKGSTEGGIAALRKVVEFDKVPAVMTIFTHILLAQIPYADSKGVVLISTVQSPGMAEKSRWNFIYSVQAKDELTLLLGEAKRQGLKRLFTFEPDNAWGRAIYNLTKKMWVDQGGGTYENAYYKYGETDFRGLVVRAQSFQPDALLLYGQGTPEDGLIIKQVREAGLKTPLFITSTQMMPVVRKASAGAEEGAILTDAPRTGERYERLAKEFKKRTGEDPWIHVSCWYDIARMLMEGIDKGGYNARGIRDYLAHLKNFRATGGHFISFDANGLAKPAVRLYQIKDNQIVPYSPK